MLLVALSSFPISPSRLPPKTNCACLESRSRNKNHRRTWYLRVWPEVPVFSNQNPLYFPKTQLSSVPLQPRVPPFEVPGLCYYPTQQRHVTVTLYTCRHQRCVWPFTPLRLSRPLSYDWSGHIAQSVTLAYKSPLS